MSLHSAGFRACLLASIAALAACAAEGPAQAPDDEGVDEVAAADVIGPLPILSCATVAPNASSELGGVDDPYDAFLSPASYGSLWCNRYVADVQLTTSSIAAGLEYAMTIDGYGNSPPGATSITECNDYREDVTVYKRSLQSHPFARIGGGRRHGSYRPLQIGPTGQITPPRCAVVEDDDFDAIPTPGRCAGTSLCPEYRVAVRAYQLSTGVERAVKVFVGNEPD